jgi:hypothetical protein
MRIGELQDIFGVSGGSYQRFMSENGNTKGQFSDTYTAACRYFQAREMAGEKIQRAKKAKPTNDSAGAGAEKEKVSGKKLSAKASEKDFDVSDINLDGEDSGKVPIFDTCDDIRNQINRFMRGGSITTNAAFVRLINAALPGSATNPASTRTLTTFLNGKGPGKGCESPVFVSLPILALTLTYPD